MDDDLKRPSICRIWLGEQYLGRYVITRHLSVSPAIAAYAVSVSSAHRCEFGLQGKYSTKKEAAFQFSLFTLSA
jgi:hypothetical protein